jgi:hypothetical protein
MAENPNPITTEDSDLSEADQLALMEILKECEKEDEYTRQRMLREAKQNDLYWHGFQYIFWDQNVGDFRVPTHDVMEATSSNEDTKFIYDYIDNIFKAHGLSIIAALSAEVPGVPFSPRDADKPEDVRAAKKAEQLGKIIAKQNKTKLIFYQALFTLFNNHYVAAYNYYDRDKKYGSVKTPKFKMGDVKVSPDTYDCAECGYSTDVNLNDCPECKAPLKLNEGPTEQGPVEDGYEETFKGFEKINIKGTLNVKLPTYAVDQAACGYLIEYTDQHYGYLRTMYPKMDRNKLKQGDTSSFEKIARMQSLGRLYTDSYLTSLLTLKRAWFRPWMFNILDEDRAASLLKRFPDGVRLEAVEDTFAKAEAEKLDDHWTITKGDLSRSIHGDPLSKPLLPMQDLENTSLNLMVESFEHSVPSTFADPEILDFESYSKQEVSPGSVYPAKTPLNSQKRLGDYFYELKTSSIPAEAVSFDRMVENKSQFVVGAFPSIFGGPQTEGSKTLGEYQESRNYALQRLSIPYQLLYFWWADLIHKCVLDHIGSMIEDEVYPQPSADGQFHNQSFLQEEFQEGTFDLLLPESSTNLPVSFDQKRTLLQNMVQLNNELINEFLFSPENRRVVFRFLGLEELSDLDSTQATKQLSEISSLLKGQPQKGQGGQEQSSVMIEPEIDDNAIHLRVIRNFLSSDTGQDLKKSNPLAYLNCLLHGREHQQQLMMAQMQAAPPSNNNQQANPAQNKGPQVKAPVASNNGGPQ